MKTRISGIEPIIAVVILVAVTLVTAIGVIGWIMGWWGTFGATESLQFYPDSNITITSTDTSTSVTLFLHLKNTGSASAVIYKVELIGMGTPSLASVTSTVAGTISISGAEVTINPGAEGYIAFTITGTDTAPATVTPGTNYQVKVYTRAGNVYTWTVQAKA